MHDFQLFVIWSINGLPKSIITHTELREHNKEVRHTFECVMKCMLISVTDTESVTDSCRCIGPFHWLYFQLVKSVVSIEGRILFLLSLPLLGNYIQRSVKILLTWPVQAWTAVVTHLLLLLQTPAPSQNLEHPSNPSSPPH